MMATPGKELDQPKDGVNVPCKVCHRKFHPDRIQIHEDICSRTFNKKRKVFNSAKQRIDGTELANFQKKAKSKPKASPTAEATKGGWRKKHEEFITSMRAAREVQAHLARGGKLADLPPPPPSENPDYIQCPHCGRRFNEAAARRHIPACATMIHNKPNKVPNTTNEKKK